MPTFNHTLHTLGRATEDKILPTINEYYNCDFKRNENIFDVFDFKDEENNIIVEVKGRRIKSTQYDETIITMNKVTEGLKKIDLGFQVFFVFVFIDKTLEYELTEDSEFNVKITGTNSIEHAMIPITELKELLLYT